MWRNGFESTNNALFWAPLFSLCRLIYQISQCSSMWRGCPSYSVLSLPTKKHTWVWHIPWQTGINGLTSIFTALCPESGLLNDSDNKNSMSCLCYGKRSTILLPPTWYGCNQLCAWLHKRRSGFDKRSLDPSDSAGSQTLSLCKLQSITSQKIALK